MQPSTRWMVRLGIAVMVVTTAMAAGCEREDEPTATPSSSAEHASSADAGPQDSGHRASPDKPAAAAGGGSEEPVRAFPELEAIREDVDLDNVTGEGVPQAGPGWDRLMPAVTPDDGRRPRGMGEAGSPTSDREPLGGMGGLETPQ